ncbi:hypothetical protein TanjilG_18114 [Lupinus angustifolius]|uniref:Uncharacterized protein n=1 Tax=Lupinus angustifolius TaxID=3871 RepID=A0A1J7IES7_LUPAN|nr:hypothetical protein TanjilG_18114 [Lupinus angustifolius]
MPSQKVETSYQDTVHDVAMDYYDSKVIGNILVVADGNNNVTLWKEAIDGDWQQVIIVDP